MLEVRSLRKSYSGRVAVDGVSFGADEGQTVGLLGPNGAGKTTIASIIAGLLRPDAGEVRIAGEALRRDDDPLKRSVGLVPQDLGLYDELSALENLRFYGSLYGLSGAALRKAADQALELAGLTSRATGAVAQFSGGMKRRLNLAASLLHDPHLLILDEPTVGVDPQSRIAIFDTLKALRQAGKTLVYTTHYMEEAERLCDRLVIIDHGRLIADDTLKNLVRLPSDAVLQIELAPSDAPGPAVEELRSLAGVHSAERQDGVLRIGVRNLGSDSGAVLGWLAERGHRVQHVASERRSLESVFLGLTGRSLRDQ